MRKVLFFCILSMVYSVSTVCGLLKVQVNRGIFSPIPIAVVDFNGDGELGKNLRQIIANDLGGSGLFKTIPQDAYIQDKESLQNRCAGVWDS
jgi:TolB protein